MISEVCSWGCAPPDITASLKGPAALGCGRRLVQAGNHINLGNWSPPSHSPPPVSTPARVCPPQQPGRLRWVRVTGHAQTVHSPCSRGTERKVKWRVLSKSHMSQREAAQSRNWGAMAMRHIQSNPAQLHNIYKQGCWCTSR